MGGAAPPAVSASGELYRANVSAVLRWAARLGGLDMDAEDIAHDVFLRAQRRLAEWRDEGGSVQTWLFRTTMRVVQERRRRDRLRQLFLLGREEVAVQSVAVSTPSPLETLERNRATALVYRALEGLPDAQRTAFILFELEGLTGQQVAEVMSARIETVWVWLHRARSRFAAQVRALNPGKES